MYNRKTIRDNLITCQQVTVTNYGFWLFCLWDSENEQKRVHVVDSESEWKRMRVVDRKPVEKKIVLKQTTSDSNLRSKPEYDL